ncbi:D-ribose ABC transporter substrate-binding protein [Brachybacterium sp. NBEC-018]|uniref:D-ribose ABC transporter substrate-binding protein n=1 Tax=Brachybacterium sp. NBEC-018 TaxID=2996004 RepID=UPI00217523AB|nr:D-ribose ABC transporter substrate-binding protein [Brachybacterium sp. NBEC-018]UVY84524.1 D-ribose ABC transporter substrate-binding protein [Brachybacterium sp. NBEC-018]
MSPRIGRRALLTAAVGGAALTACTNGEEKKAGGAAGGLIAIITPSPSNIFYKTEADAAVAEAERLGYTAQTDSHDDDPSIQSSLFDTAISNGAAAIICDNAGADVTIGAVQKAVDAGVPVFLIDREINERGIATAQIVANNSQGAGLVAESFVEAMGAKGPYLELKGKEVDTNAAVRSNAFHAIIDQYEELEMVAQETANWDQQEAFTKTQTILQAHPEIAGIVAANDTMAVGAVAAVDAVGRTGDVVVVGFDGSPDAVDAILAEKMHATGIQPAVTISEMAVQQADAYLRSGETSMPEKQSVDCLLVDPTNADRYTLFAIE